MLEICMRVRFDRLKCTCAEITAQCWENRARPGGIFLVLRACIIQSARSHQGGALIFEYALSSARRGCAGEFHAADVHVNYLDQFSADVIPRESIKGDVTFMDGGCDAVRCRCTIWEDSLFSVRVRCGVAQKRKLASLLLRTQVLTTHQQFPFLYLKMVNVRMRTTGKDSFP